MTNKHTDIPIERFKCTDMGINSNHYVVVRKNDLDELEQLKIAIQLIYQKDYIEKSRVVELLDRLNLEFNVIVCECGEPYKNTDPHNIIKEAKTQLGLEE